jgi:putative PIN family toxin of toxin-antitoxin system
MSGCAACWVIDTNTALDFLVFEDPRAQALLQNLRSGACLWLVCQPMRDELERVLDYPLIAKRRAQRGLTVQAVLAQFDALSHMQAVPAKAVYTCKDPDDQVFIDLAVAHAASLVSKDHAVLAMRGRLKRLGIAVMGTVTAAA